MSIPQAPSLPALLAPTVNGTTSFESTSIPARRADHRWSWQWGLVLERFASIFGLLEVGSYLSKDYRVSQRERHLWKKCRCLSEGLSWPF
jgi:hypothetical protein